MGLPIEWTKNLKSKSDKEDFEKTLRNSTVAMFRLKEILESWDNGLNSKELREDTYADASWAFKQAHRNGERATIKKLLDLLSYMEK
jgi:hypothetical protein